MMQINLLPWREQGRQIKKRRFLVGMAASAVCAILLIIIIHIFISAGTHSQYYVNEYLQDEVNDEQVAVNSTITEKRAKTELETQLNFIINIYKSSYSAVRFLGEISNMVPPTIFLSRIVRDDKHITLIGYAANDSDVTNFLESIKKSPIFTNVVLNQITSGLDTNGGKRIFQIYAEQKD